MSEVYKKIVSQYDTPLYLYNIDRFRKNIYKLKDNLWEGSNLLFSVKANPLLEFCKCARETGCGIEVASGGELELALRAGIAPSNIVFTGPGKTERELRLGVQKDIYVINVESMREIKILQKVAEQENKMVSIALRINPDIRKSTGKMQMTGAASQFGIDEEKLSGNFFEEIFYMSRIQLIGIHIYIGTSILDEEEICKNTEYAIRLGLKLARKYIFELKYLNVGGGFGIPYFENELALDVGRMKERMSDLKEKYDNLLRNTELFFESGRYLLADCGVFLTKVLYRKESKGRVYLICDGGSNFHASSAFLGRFVRGNFPMHVLGKTGNEKEFYITGPLCTPTDLLGQQVSLPENTKEGDIIIIEKSGAYGLSFSPYGFLSHKLPLEIGYEEGKETKILNE